MTEKSDLKQREIIRKKSHMPEDSLLFEKLVPVMLVGLAVVTVGMIVYAAAVLLGFIQF